MVMHGPFRASGGMITLTREPSTKRASAIGLDSSTRRPTVETMRSITSISCLGPSNVTLESIGVPFFST